MEVEAWLNSRLSTEWSCDVVVHELNAKRVAGMQKVFGNLDSHIQVCRCGAARGARPLAHLRCRGRRCGR